MKEIIEQLGTPYYKIKYSVEGSTDNSWVAEVRVTRKDTGEEVRYGCARYGGSKEQVESEIFQTVKQNASLLSMRPVDWNSNTRKILARCLVCSSRVTNFCVRIDDLETEERRNQAAVNDFLHFCSEFKYEIIDLVRDINALSPEERMELLTSPAEIYDNPDDPFNLDDLAARDEIFAFFINPTIAEIAAHEAHLAKMGRSDENGGIF